MAYWRNDQGSRTGKELYQPEATALIAHILARDTFPNERLDPFSLFLALVHESDGELTTGHPDDVGGFEYQFGQPVGKRHGER